jgi:hypothetical protein
VSDSKLDNIMLERIMDRLQEVGEMTSAMDKKMDLHIQETKYELKAIRDLDMIQNAILEEHHKRSDGLARDNQLREQALRNEIEAQERRIKSLEAPRVWWALTKKWLIGLGAVGGALAAVYELIQHLLGK